VCNCTVPTTCLTKSNIYEILSSNFINIPIHIILGVLPDSAWINRKYE